MEKQKHEVTYICNGIHRTAIFDNFYDAQLFGRALRENAHTGHNIDNVRIWEISEVKK